MPMYRNQRHAYQLFAVRIVIAAYYRNNFIVYWREPTIAEIRRTFFISRAIEMGLVGIQPALARGPLTRQVALLPPSAEQFRDGQTARLPGESTTPTLTAASRPM
jgi:hypothetical protein